MIGGVGVSISVVVVGVGSVCNIVLVLPCLVLLGTVSKKIKGEGRKEEGG